MRKKNTYLTMEEKKDLALNGKAVPICINRTSQKNSFIAKIRGSIFDGSLNNKKFSI